MSSWDSQGHFRVGSQPSTFDAAGPLCLPSVPVERTMAAPASCRGLVLVRSRLAGISALSLSNSFIHSFFVAGS